MQIRTYLKITDDNEYPKIDRKSMKGDCAEADLWKISEEIRIVDGLRNIPPTEAIRPKYLKIACDKLRELGYDFSDNPILKSYYEKVTKYEEGVAADNAEIERLKSHYEKIMNEKPKEKISLEDYQWWKAIKLFNQKNKWS